MNKNDTNTYGYDNKNISDLSNSNHIINNYGNTLYSVNNKICNLSSIYFDGNGLGLNANPTQTLYLREDFPLNPIL